MPGSASFATAATIAAEMGSMNIPFVIEITPKIKPARPGSKPFQDPILRACFENRSGWDCGRGGAGGGAAREAGQLLSVLTGPRSRAALICSDWPAKPGSSYLF